MVKIKISAVIIENAVRNSPDSRILPLYMNPRYVAFIITRYEKH